MRGRYVATDRRVKVNKTTEGLKNKIKLQIVTIKCEFFKYFDSRIIKNI